MTACSPQPPWAERAIAGAAALLLLVPWLFFSSPEYREAGVRWFGIAALAFGWKTPAVRRAMRDRKVRSVLIYLLVAYLASTAGGWRHGETPAQTLWLAFSGAAGVLGVGVFAVVLLQPPWRVRVVRVAAAVAVMLLVASLLGFFVFFDWQVALSKGNPHADPQRLALVWPTRLFAASMGQQFWDHTNTAAYLFAVAWAVLVDALFHRPRFAWVGWGLALLLGVAIFLTASRSAWLMIAVTLPFLLAFRGWRSLLAVVALLGISLGIGAAGLSYQLHQLAPPDAAAKGAAAVDWVRTHHVSGVVGRGSSGRLVAYQWLWDDLAGERLLGHGLAETRSPAGVQLHEHSSYLATLRGGGLVALGAHLVVLAIAGFSALQLARRGCRWPLVFAVAVFSGLLFDRSTVFRLTGFDEFLLHWLAVWIPLAMLLRSRTEEMSLPPDSSL